MADFNEHVRLAVYYCGQAWAEVYRARNATDNPQRKQDLQAIMDVLNVYEIDLDDLIPEKEAV